MASVAKQKLKSASVGAFISVVLFIVSIFVTAEYSHSFQNWYTTNEYFDWNTMAISHFGVSNLGLPFTIVVSVVSLLQINFFTKLKTKSGNIISVGFLALMLAFIFMQYQPNSPLSIAVHFLFAMIYFVSIPVGIIMAGIYFLQKNNHFLGYSSLALGSLSFIFGPIICMGSSLLLGNKGVAIPEFAQIVCEDIWIILLATEILRKIRNSKPVIRYGQQKCNAG